MKTFKLEIDAENTKVNYSCEGVDLIVLVEALSTVVSDIAKKSDLNEDYVKYIFFRLVVDEFVHLGSFTLKLLDTWIRIKTWLKHF